MTTVFYEPKNNVKTTIGVAGYRAGSGYLDLNGGDGAMFGPVTRPVRITVIRRAAGPQPTDPTQFTIYRVTARSGDRLTIETAIEGTTDRNYSAGDTVECRLTRDTLEDIHGAVNTLEAGGGAGTQGPAGPAGAPGAPGSAWREGSGVPSNALGIDGDFFLDIFAGDVYAKSAGAYFKVGNIQGPPGSGGGFTDTAYADLRQPAFGADINGTANENAIQEMHDSLLSTAPGGTLDGGPNSSAGVCKLPPGTWLTSKHVWWDGDNIFMEGVSKHTSIIQTLSGAPPIIVGFKRRTAWNRSLKGYLTFSGPLIFRNGQATVTGTGTNFSTVLGPYAAYPRYVTADLVTFYQVASVESNTSLTITSAYTGADFTTADGLNKGAIGYLETINKIFAADHRVDMWNGGTPDLDSSMVTAAGQRWALTAQSPTSGSPWPDHGVTWFACPGPNGNLDCWEDMQGFTLDLGIKGKGGGRVGPCYILGMGDSNNPNPWIFQTGDLLSGTPYAFYFLTKEGVRDASNSPRRFYFGDPSLAVGPQCIAIQVDFLTPAVRAWIGPPGGPMIEQAITLGYGMSNPSPAPLTEPAFVAGLHFQGNEPGEPLVCFGNSPGSTGFGSSTTLAQRGNFSLTGLRMTNGLRYTSDGSGHQILAPGVTGTLNDDFRFNDAQDHARSFFCVDTTMPPTADYHGKIVPTRGGPINQTYYGLFISPFAESISAVTSHTGFRNLRLNSGSQGSNGLLIGPTLHIDIDGCYFQGWCGIGATGGMATYNININNSEFAAPCAWIYGASWIVNVTACRISDIGRWCMIFDGCNVTIEGVPTSNSAANNRGLFKLTSASAYGFRWIIRKVLCDNEGTFGQFQAAVYAERSTSGNYLEVDDFIGGTIAPGAVVIDLVDKNIAPPPAYSASVAKISNVWGGGAPVVRTNGPGWEGEITNCDWSSSPEWVRNTGADGQSNIVAHMRMDTMPRSGIHQANAETVAIRHPAVGAAASFICSQSGYAAWDVAMPYKVGQVVNYAGVNYTAAAISTGSAPGGGNPDWTAGSAGPVAMWAPLTTLGTPRQS